MGLDCKADGVDLGVVGTLNADDGGRGGSWDALSSDSMVEDRRAVLKFSPDTFRGVGKGGASVACRKRAGEAGGGIDRLAGVKGLLESDTR